MADDFGFKPSVSEEPSVDFAPEGTLKPKSSLVKNVTGMFSGAADVAAGLVSMPVSGLVGGATAFVKGAEAGAQAVHKTQEMLTPSRALEKLGVPEDYLSNTGTSQLIGKIVSAPHDYISVPIADKYFDLTGNKLTASLLQGALDIPAYFLAFKAGGAAARAGARPRSVEQLREEAGYGEKPAPKIDTTQYKQQGLDVGFKPSEGLELPPDSELAFQRPEGQAYFGGGRRSGGILDPELKARLEAELNPPTEQRVAGQGELFTSERAYPEAFPGESRPEPLRPSNREVDVAVREDVLDIPDRTNQRVRPADEFQPTEPRPNYSNMGVDETRSLFMADDQLTGRRNRSLDPAFEGSIEPMEPYKGTLKALERDDTPRPREGGEIPYETPPNPRVTELQDAYKKIQTALSSTKDPNAAKALRLALDDIVAKLEKEGGTRETPIDLPVPKASRIAELQDAYKKITDALNRTSDPNAKKALQQALDDVVGKLQEASVPTAPWRGPGSRQRGAIGEPPKPKPKNLQEAHKDLQGRVADTASEMRELVASWQQEGRYKWKAGDIVQSKTSGKTYTVTPHLGGRYSSPKRGGKGWEHWPTYRLKRDLKEGEDGFSSFDAKVENAESGFVKIGETPRDPFKGPGGKQAGALNLFGKSVGKSGAVKAIEKFKELWTTDTRPIKEVLDEKYPDGLKPEQVVDIVPKGSQAESRIKKLSAQGWLNFGIPKQIAILAKDKGPIGEIINWAVSNQERITRQAKQSIEESVTSALEPWRNLRKQSVKELSEMLALWQEKSKNREILTEQDFASERQWKAFKAVEDVFEDIRKRSNEARAKSDPSGRVLKPLQKRESYFPGIREGDWWFHVKDSSGRVLETVASKTVWEANSARKKALKEFKDEEGITVSDVEAKKISEHDLDSLVAYEETLQALTKDDPVAKAIQQRLNFLYGTRGFGRHGMRSKGIGGALGFEGGKRGLKNAEKVIETYITRGEKHIANLERSAMEREISALSEQKYWKDAEGRVHQRATLFENAPIAKQWLDAYLARNKGGMTIADNLTAAADNLTHAAGGSKGMVVRGIQNMSSAASLFYLATVRNALVQITQPMNALAKMAEIHQLSGDHGITAILKSPITLFDGMVEAYKPAGGLKREKLSEEAKRWAIDNGHLESAIVNMIEGRLSNWQGEGPKLLSEIARVSMGKIETHMVRTPVLLGFEKALRQIEPNKIKRFEMAAQLTDNYMVHYDRESAPLMYDKMGQVLGESTRGLKQYSHNTFGQFFEYIQTAKEKKNVVPLATMLGTQLAVGGARGLFLVAEATAVITALNMLLSDFDVQIPTPEELMLAKGWNNLAVFGGVSMLLGKDVSASVAAPNMPAFFNFVPIEFTAKIAKETWNYLSKKASGTAKDEDLMRFALATTPNLAHGWITALFSKEGGKIPNPYDKMKGNYPVPEAGSQEYMERFGLNLRSIDEAKWNMIMRNAQRVRNHDLKQKLDVIDAIVDRAENKEQLSPELIERYIKEGGNMKQLPQIIKKKLIERQMDYAERIMRSPSITPNKLHQLEQMQRLMDKELEERIRNKKDKRSDVGGIRLAGGANEYIKEFDDQIYQQREGFGPPRDRRDRRDREIRRLPDGRPEGPGRMREIPYEPPPRNPVRYG